MWMGGVESQVMTEPNLDSNHTSNNNERAGRQLTTTRWVRVSYTEFVGGVPSGEN